MPKIYEYFGLIFFFYSNEHVPIHVHVSHGEYESKLEYVYDKGVLKSIRVVSVKGSKPLPSNLLKDAVKFAKAREAQISKKWLNYFGKNIIPVCEKITKKI